MKEEHTTTDVKDLARRAVACKAWRWMPGMWSTESTLWCGHSWSDGLRSWEGDIEDALPDLTDPATVGCLLHLVREHWGDHGTHTKRVYRSGGYVEWICYAPSIRYPLIMSHGDSEAEALVKALEMEVPNGREEYDDEEKNTKSL